MTAMIRGNRERGATAVEYALIVGLCVLVLVGGLAALSGGLDIFYGHQTAEVETEWGGPGGGMG